MQRIKSKPTSTRKGADMTLLMIYEISVRDRLLQAGEIVGLRYITETKLNQRQYGTYTDERSAISWINKNNLL
jgi:hypothetical protein